MTRTRPPTPPKIIREIIHARQRGLCASCQEPVGDDACFDHRPALWSRERVEGKPNHDPAAYRPHAHDPAHLDMLHGKRTSPECHDTRTFGDGLNRGDVSNAAKSDRLSKKQADFRARVLAKTASDVPEPRRKSKYRWPTRKMESRNTLRRSHERVSKD